MSAPYVLAVTGVKTNSGRTTATLALAWAFGRKGLRVLVVDANQYPELLPSKSETGAPELWERVALGARKAGEAQRVGANVVVLDAPALNDPLAERVLRGADAIVVCVSPNVPTLRVLPEASSRLAACEPTRVLGWFLTTFDAANQHQQSLEADLSQRLADRVRLRNVPLDTGLARWKPLTGEELPEGSAREAFLELGSKIAALLVAPPAALPRARAPLRAAKGTAPTRAASPAPPAAPATVGREPTASRPQPKTAATPKIPAGEIVAEPTPRPAAQPATSPAAVRPAAPQRGEDGAPQSAASAASPQPAQAPAQPAQVPAQPAQVPAQPASSPPAVAPIDPPAPLPSTPAPGGTKAGARPWRLLGSDTRISVVVVPRTAPLEPLTGVELFPASLEPAELAARVQAGLVHTLDREPSVSPAASHPPRPRLRCEAVADPADVKPKDRRLAAACRALAAGDAETARAELAKAAKEPDARFLAGVLELSRGESAPARELLASAIEDAEKLDRALGRLELGALVSLELGGGVTVHSGCNARGARFALLAAHVAAGDVPSALLELNQLLDLEPEDLVLRAVYAEQLLERGTTEALKAVNRATLLPTYDTALHASLALSKAQALHRLGLPHAAKKLLGEALYRVGERCRPLRQALLYERAQVFETLRRAPGARRDLELLYAEAPDYADVAARLGL